MPVPKPDPAAKAPPVNGIPVDAVRALAGAISADPAAGQTHWQVTSTWQGGARSRSCVEGFGLGGKAIGRRHQMYIDEPLELGGGNMDANPQEYLLAALNGCMTMGFTALCALEDIRIDELEITTQGEIDLRGFLGLDARVSPGYDALETTVKVKGSATPVEFDRIFQAMLLTSPNVHNITRGIPLSPKLVVG